MVAGGFLDFEESVRPSKVLQGQENIGSASSPLQGFDVMNLRILYWSCSPMQIQFFYRVELRKDSTPLDPACSSGVMDLDSFPMVLRGQEVCSLRSFPQLAAASGKSIIGYTSPFAYQDNKSSFYPLASQWIRSMHIPYQNPYKAANKSVGHPSCAINFETLMHKYEGGLPKNVTADLPFKIDMMTPAASNLSKRICTKQGSMVGRATDLSRLSGYNDLLTELERLFNMEGLLKDPEKGWRMMEDLVHR
ncbi:LOW QUALITY PROTEIN: hypothetical protein HID58_045828 [Brassica napus]|uniref:Uncharacterized protein n=1 Tax=Brassica napus TaxID=3708 RepID=A0ABQ8AW62_BRANA|nr:LOW QUALITY PROTEIN: hypothetical protein HID58_045828 [Brassica napus]